MNKEIIKVQFFPRSYWQGSLLLINDTLQIKAHQYLTHLEFYEIMSEFLDKISWKYKNRHNAVINFLVQMTFEYNKFVKDINNHATFCQFLYKKKSYRKYLNDYIDKYSKLKLLV